MKKIFTIVTLCIVCSAPAGTLANGATPTAEQSRAELKATIRDTPFSPNAWYHLARSYLGLSSDSNQSSVNQDLQTSGEFYEDAVRYLEADDTDAAIIQLRNAIQIDPANLSAYLLIAEIYEELRSPVAAQHYLKQAQVNGADPALVAIPLAQAMLKSEMFEEILAEIPTTNLPLRLRARIRVIQGQALTGLQDYTGARDAFEEALRLSNDLTLAKIEIARVEAISGNITAAAAQLAAIAAEADAFEEYWLIKAELSQRQGQTTQAMDEYKKALQLAPDARLALTALAQLMLEAGEVAQAAELIADIRTFYPNDLRGIQLELLHAVEHSDKTKLANIVITAKAVIDQVDYGKLQRDPLGLYVVGTIHQLSDRPEEAATVLASYLEFVPDDLNAMSMLVAAQLEAGLLDPALRTIRNAPESVRQTSRFRNIAAEVHIARKDFIEAGKFLDQLLVDNPDDPALRLKRAKIFANLGEYDTALAEMNQLHDAEYSAAQSALANLLLALGEYERVIKLVGDSEDTAILRGKALLATNALTQARTTFQTFLAQNSESTEARFNLAVIDRLEGLVDSAEQRLLGILKSHPDHRLALLQMHAISEDKGDRIAAARYLRRAVSGRADRDNSIKLIELLMADNREQEARSAMSDLKAQFPSDLTVLATEASIALTTGNTDRAKQIYVGMRNLAIEHGSLAELVDIARFQFSINDRPEADTTIAAGIKINPEYVPLIVTMAEFEQNKGNLAEAILHTNRIIALAPELSVGYRLKGDLLKQQGDTKAAIAIYAQGVETASSSVALILGYYSLLREVDSPDAALRFLEDYTGNGTAISYAVLRVLAAAYSDTKDYQASIELHERLKTERPRDPILLNNLALAYFMAGDSRARQTAELAYEIAPNNFAIMDTLGWILINEDELSLGTTMLRNALARSANEPDIRYHYAVALARGGQSKAALRELKKLQNEGATFKYANEVKTLLAELTAP